jgi:hypothetical protein
MTKEEIDNMNKDKNFTMSKTNKLVGTTNYKV